MGSNQLKSSKIDWIGLVPYHWKKDKLFRLCDKMGSGGTPRSTNQEFYNGDIPWIQSGDLTDSYVSESEKKITNEALATSSAKMFPKGTLLVAMYGATIGKLGIMEMDAATNQACCALQLSTKLHSKFTYYLMRDVRDYLITQAYGGGQPNISQEILKQLHLFYPSLPEQKAIADYLDKACHRIDKIIEIKERQLEKIQKHYSSRLHEAITKGLDNSAELINSRVAWQGLIPNHWKRDKLFRLSDKMGSGGTPRSSNQEYYDGVIPWIQSGDLNDGIVSETKKKINERAILESSAKMFEKGTVLIAMYGATIGKLGIMGMDAATNQACCAIQISRKIDSLFLFYALYDMRQFLISSGYGGGQQNISQEVLKQQYFYYPTIEEQLKIVDFIKQLENKKKTVETNINSQITTLQSYRKSLIHECVTGKKQVWEGEIENRR